jgi:hypothetical protein
VPLGAVAVPGDHRERPALVAEHEERGVRVGHLGGLGDDDARRRLRLRARQQALGDAGGGGQPLLAPVRLLEQAGVLDRDAGRRRQRHDQLLVALGELAAVALLGEVEVAEGLAAHEHRDAEERAHRRVVGREAGRRRVPGEVRQPDRRRLVDEQAEDALAARQVPDLGAGVRVDADGDELDEVAPLGPEDAERGVVRVGEVGRELRDAAQRVGQAEVARHRHDGVQQPVHLLLGVEDLLRAVDELAQQRVQPEARHAGGGPGVGLRPRVVVHGAFPPGPGRWLSGYRGDRQPTAGDAVERDPQDPVPRPAGPGLQRQREHPGPLDRVQDLARVPDHRDRPAGPARGVQVVRLERDDGVHGARHRARRWRRPGRRRCPRTGGSSPGTPRAGPGP